MLRYAIKILLVVALLSSPTTSWAKIKNILPSGVHLSFDIARPLYYLWSEKTGAQYELHTSLDFNRILLEGRYGVGSIIRKSPPLKPISIAENIGTYFQIGLGYNFINNSREHNAAFLGVGYSKAYFTDYLHGTLQEEGLSFWKAGSNIESTAINQNDKLQAHWFEIMAGVRVRTWKWIYIGCTFRYKFAKKINAVTYQNPFDIIGWGINEEDVFGVNYYLSIRIPLQSDTPEQTSKVSDVTLDQPITTPNYS